MLPPGKGGGGKAHSVEVDGAGMPPPGRRRRPGGVVHSFTFVYILGAYRWYAVGFFLSSALPSICVHFQFLSVAEWVLTGGEARVAGHINLATAAWGINLTAKALRSSVWEYIAVRENLNSG
jgi:hypothetical protein